MVIFEEGTAKPLGSTATDDGANFSIFSENATGVRLEIYRNATDASPAEIINLEKVTDNYWHVFVPGLKPGTLYGYRVDGLYDPPSGHRFNNNKLLIDPYAKALTGHVELVDSVFGYQIGRDDLSFSKSDSGIYVPKAVVIDPEFDWKGSRSPNTNWRDTVIYETHVKGATYRLESIYESLRGKYLGLGSPEMIQYLQDLRITAVELMPIHHSLDDRVLIERGLHNYWGYNTISYFAPDTRFASSSVYGEQVKEFKTMVRNFHNAGIEVILDVVYNHTGEGNRFGPTLSFRGIDNSIYYRLDGKNRRFYNDFTGTGNSLDAREPQVLQLIMDSLRYWVIDMHVDGFRFDLAAALARQLHDVDALSAFFAIIHQDPVISQVKLIAEPWDVGPGGYQVGNFPPGWAEWNGKYRDSVRRFWRGDEGILGELATRLSGSPDLYEVGGRTPHASINYICSHDGFTMYDLVSYERKHNEANGDRNSDGMDENYSMNFGFEGDTDVPVIQALRMKRIKNLFTTLLVSNGVPMILGGDEILRTQRGNNNAYCQDNETSWNDWNLTDQKKEMLEFVRRLITLRRSIPSMTRTDFFTGRYLYGANVKDITWLRPDGQTMQQEDWENPHAKAVGIIVSGMVRRPYGEPEVSPDTMLLFNASNGGVLFNLPEVQSGWELTINSFEELDSFPRNLNSYELTLPPDSSAVLRKRVLPRQQTDSD